MPKGIPAAQAATEFKERSVNVGAELETNTESTEVMHSGMRAFNTPAIFAKAVAMFGKVLGDLGLDTAIAQRASISGNNYARSVEFVPVFGLPQSRESTMNRPRLSRNRSGLLLAAWRVATRASDPIRQRYASRVAVASMSRPNRSPSRRAGRPAQSGIENEQDAGQRGAIRNSQAAEVIFKFNSMKFPKIKYINSIWARYHINSES